jgi:GrpB-like predicted nucleotidyltransferase (UPF0157 family)
MNKNLGVKRGEVKIVPYDKSWPEIFQEEKVLLVKTFGDRIFEVEHVGSTAIPGLPAKPIIDISATIESLDEVNNFIEKLSAIGYDYIQDKSYPNPEYLDRHFFVKSNENGSTHFLKLVEPGNKKDWVKLIQFRDYLLTHPDARDAYAELKKELAENLSDNRSEYTERKPSFIESIFKNIES